jgi:CRP/FNR family transcriptional regulator, nitrogen oxide reductase regulator
MKARRKTPLDIQTTPPNLCTVDLRLRLLADLPFFAGLSPADVAAINQHFREVGFEPDEMIYLAGDPAARMFVVAEGRVKLFQSAANGRNVLLNLLAPGEFFGGLFSLGTEAYVDTAQAQTSACILQVSSDEFRKILDRHPGVAIRVLEVMAQRLQAANERVFLLSTSPVERRVAVTLLKLAGKMGRKRKVGLLIDMPLSRENLADMTGSTPESVSRAISQFQKEGWIATGRMWIALKDLVALQEIAEGV